MSERVVTVEVEITAMGAVRPVDVPAGEWPVSSTEAALELVFKYGQNDFQPKPFYSVSVGDVIRLDGARWLVAPYGFELVS